MQKLVTVQCCVNLKINFRLINDLLLIGPLWRLMFSPCDYWNMSIEATVIVIDTCEQADTYEAYFFTIVRKGSSREA